MILTMPDQSWFSIGFGANMNNVDMIGWHADGADSYVRDYFSKTKNTPPEDDEQNLDSEVPEFTAKDPNTEGDYDRVSFVTYRDLDTGDAEQDYLVPLDEEIDMVYGILTYSKDWNEHNKRGVWSMKIH